MTPENIQYWFGSKCRGSVRSVDPADCRIGIKINGVEPKEKKENTNRTIGITQPHPMEGELQEFWL